MEASFGDDTTLIMLRTNEKHPQLGEGLATRCPFSGALGDH